MYFLIVEDDSVSQVILTRLLDRAVPGAAYLYAEDEQGALALIERYSDAISIAFLDEDLRGGGRGSQVAREIRNLVPVHTPILVLTSGPGPTCEEDARLFDAAWGKPYPSVEDAREQLTALCATKG